MIEIRFHGRGGQGAVTSAELLATAAINLGKYAQAFPSFGPERRGAPVMAFCRISNRRIRTREQVYKPDIVIVLDPALIDIVDVTAGLKSSGVLVINSSSAPDEIKRERGIKQRVATCDATRIATEIIGRAITNTTMLGALIKATDIVPLEAFKDPLEHRFGKLADKNIKVMQRAFRETKVA
ncbi:MAG TPA: pyruvate ferredoxin oxidoreductase subunit gamma [Proteobacteria bacterium]|nr:pyruvate ferredoxin oxidoreductase subunit gamma [Pseudomonadota bacterium]